MAELLDVLDEAGRVVGTLPRERVHREGLLHRSAHLFVLDPRERLWLQQRSLDRKLWPGKWTSSVSGHVDAGESEAQAVVREAREEMGFAVQPRRVAEFRYRDEQENELAGLWLARSPQPPKPGPEVMAVMAVERGELEALRARAPETFAPSFLAALRAFGWA